MKLTIEKIYFNNANKDGQPYIDKNQRPFFRVVFTSKEQIGKISTIAYQDDPQMKWKSGDVIEGELTKKGDFLNFDLPKAQKINSNDVLMIINDLQNRVSALEKGQGVDLGEAMKVMKEDSEIYPMDIPF